MTVNEFLLEVRNFLDFGGIIVFPASIVVAVCVALVPVFRRKRYWLSILVLGLAVSLGTAFDLYERTLRRIANFYTYTLYRHRTFDGIVFPADSTVKVSMIPPHHVMGGTVPAPTQVYGLTLIKDFETRPPTTTETIVVSRGTLAIGAAIHGIPCGPGIFWDDRDGQWFGPYDRHARPLHFQKPDSVS